MTSIAFRTLQSSCTDSLAIAGVCNFCKFINGSNAFVFISLNSKEN